MYTCLLAASSGLSCSYNCSYATFQQFGVNVLIFLELWNNRGPCQAIITPVFLWYIVVLNRVKIQIDEKPCAIMLAQLKTVT